MPDPDIVPLSEAQREEAARTLALAFQEDPLFRYVVPGPAERAQLLPAHFAILLRYGLLFGETFTSHSPPEGACVWERPGATVTPERAAQAGFGRISDILGSESHGRLGRMLDYLETVHHRRLPRESWYLMVAGVAPARQRQGVGSALLEPILRRADADALPCCLDTAAPQNVPFYQKLGFGVHVETVEPESGLRLWTLCREPQ